VIPPRSRSPPDAPQADNDPLIAALQEANGDERRLAQNPSVRASASTLAANERFAEFEEVAFDALPEPAAEPIADAATATATRTVGMPRQGDGR
jgi:hypothetical protein